MAEGSHNEAGFSMEAALEREVKLQRDSFNKLAGEWRAAEALAEQRHRELLAALEDGRGEVSDKITRLAEVLREYAEAFTGPRNGPTGGPGTVRKLTPRSKGKHGA